jgi:Sulfotransferase domain
MTLLRRLRRKASRTKLRVPIVWCRHRGLDSRDVFIASYPRSGSTWLRFLLFEILAGDTALFDKVNRVIADVGRHSSEGALLPGGRRLIKTHEAYRNDYQKAIYLVRDVRDVVISEFEYESAHQRISEDFDSFIMLSMRGKANGYGSWQDHLSSWLGSPLARSGKLLVVKFEEMRRQTEETLVEVLDFLGVEADRQLVRRAIANNNVQRMRAKEDRTPQISGAAAKAASGDRSRFIRSGAIGGWQARLTESQVSLIEHWAGAGLLAGGYPLMTTARELVGT